MRVKWENEKETLNRLIDGGVSYEKIGKQYGVSGNSVKKAAKKMGIQLKPRRKISPNEHFNKNKNIKTKPLIVCKNCGKEMEQKRSYKKCFCSNDCQQEYKYKEYIKRWKNGEESGMKGAASTSIYIKKYLFKKNNCKCEKCGWGEVNPCTKNIPLEIHHIDGDCTNNSENNLELLCPNCHSLTENFGSLNKNSKRFHRRKKTLND